VISDAHEGLKAAIARSLAGATWRCGRVRFMRNALAHVPRSQATVVAAAIRQAFVQPDHASATRAWRHIADQLRARWPKLGALMDDAEADVLAHVAFPMRHRAKLHSTNPLERLNKEIERRADVTGHLPQRGQHDGLDNLAEHDRMAGLDGRGGRRLRAAMGAARGRRCRGGPRRLRPVGPWLA
jgi:transposase-like protein